MDVPRKTHAPNQHSNSLQYNLTNRELSGIGSQIYNNLISSFILNGAESFAAHITHSMQEAKVLFMHCPQTNFSHKISDLYLNTISNSTLDQYIWA